MVLLLTILTCMLRSTTLGWKIGNSVTGGGLIQAKLLDDQLAEAPHHLLRLLLVLLLEPLEPHEGLG